MGETAVFRIPGGREQGVPVSEASPAAVQYWAKRIEDNLANDQSRNPGYDKKLLAALKAALAVNAGGSGKRRPARGAPGQSTPQRRAAEGEGAAAIVRRTPEQLAALAGTYSKPGDVMKVLQDASREAHLVSPQTSCGQLPVGCAVASCIVWIDPDTETYGIPYPAAEKRGLDKTALNKIAAAAGLSWVPQLSGRLDDRSHPHYVHYRAVGTVRNFDGTLRTEMGEVEIDLREGSEAAEGMSEKELPIARKFILRHAESKAKNRAIRALGVRTSYERKELDKPFVIAKIAFTGATDNPQLAALFAEKTFEAFHGSHQTLYGNAPAMPALGAGHAPPQLAGDDDYNDHGADAGGGGHGHAADAQGDDDDRSFENEDDYEYNDPEDVDDQAAAAGLPSGDQRAPTHDRPSQRPPAAGASVQQELKT